MLASAPSAAGSERARDSVVDDKRGDVPDAERGERLS
jgi:hypothetical protein